MLLGIGLAKATSLFKTVCQANALGHGVPVPVLGQGLHLQARGQDAQQVGGPGGVPQQPVVAQLARGQPLGLPLPGHPVHAHHPRRRLGRVEDVLQHRLSLGDVFLQQLYLASQAAIHVVERVQLGSLELCSKQQLGGQLEVDQAVDQGGHALHPSLLEQGLQPLKAPAPHGDQAVQLLALLHYAQHQLGQLALLLVLLGRGLDGGLFLDQLPDVLQEGQGSVQGLLAQQLQGHLALRTQGQRGTGQQLGLRQVSEQPLQGGWQPGWAGAGQVHGELPRWGTPALLQLNRAVLPRLGLEVVQVFPGVAGLRPEEASKLPGRLGEGSVGRLAPLAGVTHAAPAGEKHHQLRPLKQLHFVETVQSVLPVAQVHGGEQDVVRHVLGLVQDHLAIFHLCKGVRVEQGLPWGRGPLCLQKGTAVFPEVGHPRGRVQGILGQGQAVQGNLGQLVVGKLQQGLEGEGEAGHTPGGRQVQGGDAVEVGGVQRRPHVRQQVQHGGAGVGAVRQRCHHVVQRRPAIDVLVGQVHRAGLLEVAAPHVPVRVRVLLRVIAPIEQQFGHLDVVQLDGVHEGGALLAIGEV
uniref:Uncharacterized protein n=1 Tax=Ixodes ricinus TaxID=34613 RepID=A0A6B0VFS3_IXORI